MRSLISPKPIMFLLCAGLISATSSLAAPKEEERGRLPDGRAFRVDSEGHQVVDYIAELETTVDALTQQVIALEDQLKVNPSSKSIPSEAPSQQSAEVVCPEPVSCPVVSCSGEIERAVKGVKELTQAACDTRLQAIEAGFNQEIQSKEDRLVEERASISETSLQKLNDSEQRIAALQKALLSEQSKNVSLQNEVEALKQKPENSEVVMRSEESSVAPRLGAPSALNNPRSGQISALLSLRSAVIAESQRVQELAVQRDALYRSDKVTGGGFSIKPQAAESRNGNSIRELKSKAESANSFRQLADIRTELSEIRATLQSDINAAKRVQRLR